MSEASLIGLVLLIGAFFLVRAMLSSGGYPSMDATQAINEDGSPIALDDMDDIEQWFVEEVHSRRVAHGGRLRCDRCKTLVVDSDGEARVRLCCNAKTDEIFCAECVLPEEMEVMGEEEASTAEPGRPHLRIVK